VADAVRDTFPDLRVRHGVFRGMRYPQERAIGSALFPKLLGRYESELNDIIEGSYLRRYSHIVNIGCAEGYYAVGLACYLPDVTVYAYDTDQAALLLCRKMARLNGVDRRVMTASLCDPAVLMTLPLSAHALIISDCEGYERMLFTDEVVDFLEGHDVLIEVHDFIDSAISGELRSAFARTHRLSVINSIGPVEKLVQHRDPELRRYEHDVQLILIDEQRPVAMQWFHFTPAQEVDGG
jgi:hypothetical protein